MYTPREVTLTEKFREGPFGKSIIGELTKRGLPTAQARTLTIGIFDTSTPADERYPHALKAILKDEKSQPMMYLDRIITHLLAQVRNEALEISDRDEFKQMLIECFYHSAQCRQFIPDEVARALTMLFVNDRGGVGERTKRSFGRAFWKSLGFYTGTTGTPVLWTSH